MVRRRAGIAESDDAATTRAKLAATVARVRPGRGRARAGSSPAAGLLGLEEAGRGRREELFAAWRAFFERIADAGHGRARVRGPPVGRPRACSTSSIAPRVVAGAPDPVVTLARPELIERRPTGAPAGATSPRSHLEPLPTRRWASSCRPRARAARARRRGDRRPRRGHAAVRGRDRPDAARPRPPRARDGGFRAGRRARRAGRPETLQSLIAARLDALDACRRALAPGRRGAGPDLHLDALAAVAGQAADGSRRSCAAWSGGRCSMLDHDPRSPERGQYGFVQALIREVAYGRWPGVTGEPAPGRGPATSRRSATTSWRASSRATTCLPTASQAGPEAEAVAAQARLALRGAADRALAVASPEAATAYLRQALAVTVEPAETARLHEDIARISLRAAQWQIAEDEAGAALAAYEALDDARGVARASSVRGNILFFQGRIEASVEMLERALRGLEGTDPQLELELLRQLGRAEMFRARPQQALHWVEIRVGRRGSAGRRRRDRGPADHQGLGSRHARAVAGGPRREPRRPRVRAPARPQQCRVPGRQQPGDLPDGREPRRGDPARGRGDGGGERLGDRDNLQKLAFVAIAKVFAGEWDGASALIERWLHEDAPNLDYLPLACSRTMMLAWSGSAPTPWPRRGSCANGSRPRRASRTDSRWI